MTTPPPESSPTVVTPTPEETRAINGSFTDEEIRALAQQLIKSGQLGFEAMTLIKGIVVGYEFLGSPPTITVNISGDTTTEVPDIRILDGYSPQIGQTALIAKQGANIVALGHIADSGGYTVSSGAGGWVRADLSNGAHNANNNGDIYYRRVLDNGSWKMQWRGGWDPAGATAMIDTAKALPSDYRPTGLRSIPAARQLSGGATTVHFDFTPDGRAIMTGATTSAPAAAAGGDVHTVDPADYTDVRLSGYLSQAGSDLGHMHNVYASHDHGFSGGSHTHAVTAPGWVSLNRVEYFI